MKTVFIFPLGRRIDDALRQALEQEWAPFAASWTDHGVPIQAEMDIYKEALLVIKAQKATGEARIDGCAQDDLFRWIRHVSQRYNLPLMRFDLLPVETPDQEIQFIPHSQLKEALQQGLITPETLVYLYTARTEDEWQRQPVPLNTTPLFQRLQ